MNSNNQDFMLTSVNYSTGNVRNDFHHHNDYEIIFVTDGEIEAIINDKVYQVPKKHLIFISNLENHSIRQISPTYKRYWITLHTLATDRHIRETEFLNILKNHAAGFCHSMDVSLIYDKLLPIFNNMLSCHAEDPYANRLVNCYLNELLIHIYRLYPEHFSIPDSTCQNRILEIQKYLDANYAENLRIDEISKRFFISDCYLSHQFKEVTGYSPKKYLTLVRLKQASIQIHDTLLPISEIAYSCGFSDINNFNRQFKQVYGCTPSVFRKPSKG